MRHAQAVKRRTGVAQLGFANQKSRHRTRAGIPGRQPLRDEAVGLRARIVAELAGDQQIAHSAQPVIVRKSAAGCIREIGNGAGVIGSRSKFKARTRGLVLRFLEGIDASTQYDVAYPRAPWRLSPLSPQHGGYLSPSLASTYFLSIIPLPFFILLLSFHNP